MMITRQAAASGVRPGGCQKPGGAPQCAATLGDAEEPQERAGSADVLSSSARST
jgi:hypothetical protein